VYALLGPNGAGKSTTLQILMNLLRPSSGHAEIFGHDCRRLTAKDFTRIGYVAEGQDLPDWMTVGKLMEYLQPFYPQWDNHRAHVLLRQFALPEDAKLRHLSRGMRMKVSLASSLAYRPVLLLMDEPFSALDSLTRDELIEGLLANSDRLSVVICSHDLAEVETFASHIGYLENGRMRFSEQTSYLSERFREIEITLDGDSYVARDRWPRHWVNVERSGSMIRFVDMQFERERTMRDIKGLFHDVKQVDASPMPLRSIFVTLAKASRKAA
jgi:ABC-2 type transport system ATP-binding protein